MQKSHILMAYQVGGIRGGSVAYPQLRSSSYVFDPANSKLMNIANVSDVHYGGDELEGDYLINSFEEYEDVNKGDEFAMPTERGLFSIGDGDADDGADYGEDNYGSSGEGHDEKSANETLNNIFNANDYGYGDDREGDSYGDDRESYGDDREGNGYGDNDSDNVLESIFSPRPKSLTKGRPKDAPRSRSPKRATRREGNKVNFNREVVECNFYKSQPVKCVGDAVRGSQWGADNTDVLTNIFN